MKKYENAVVELKADVHTMWKLQCKNLYNSNNLAALAVRECVQNSLDSINAAIKQGQIKRGKIDISWSGNDLTVEDNGVGMNIATLHEKFLTLGGTTKGDADNVGGFGLAKSVILGCGTGFKVETQDNVFTSDDLGKRPIAKQAYRQGTKITCYNVQAVDGKLLEDCECSFEFSVKDYVFSSDIPKNVDIFLNGEKNAMTFIPKKSTHRLPAELGIANEMIPRDTKLRLNVYKTTSALKYLYVRLRGLTQFKTYLSWNANADIVLDIDTTIDPRSVDYPFSTNREGLKGKYQGIIEAIKDKVSQSPTSIARDNRYKETLYEGVEDGSAEQVSAARAMSAAIVSTQVESTVKNLSKVVEDIKSKGGFVPQGGYTPATILDYVLQFHDTIDNAIQAEKAEGKVSKSKIVEALPSNTLFKLNNPLSYSWMVYEDTEWKHARISKSKIVSVVALWDLILKLMTSNYRRSSGCEFYPGIILEKDVLGLTMEKIITKDGTSERRCYVMLNPLSIPSGSSQKIALWMMGVAAHELAHCFCGSFEAHGETFSYTREAIMNDNLDEVSNVMSMVKASHLTSTSAPTEYSKMSLEDLEDLAVSKGVDLEVLRNKYSNPSIYRMRLTMAVKKVA